MKKLRMGIIGVGMAFERLHYPVFQQLKEQYEIAALADPVLERAAEWARKLGLKEGDIYQDYRQMIKREDLDAFDIMVPIDLNYEVTAEVAAAGKPIISEKPLAPDRGQALTARDLPGRFKVPIMIAENYRYNEENNIIRDLIQTQEIGVVYYFVQNRVMDFPADMLKNTFAAREWRQHPGFPGGVFLDTAVHDIAALRHIFGAVENVQGFGVEQDEEFVPYVVIQANLLFKRGVSGQFSFFSAGKEMQRPLIGLRIFGSEGMIYLEERDCGTVNVAYNDGRSRQIPYQPRAGYYHELLNFYKAAAGEEPLSVTPELEFGDSMTVFAILESIREKKVVQVDERKEYKPIYH